MVSNNEVGSKQNMHSVFILFYFYIFYFYLFKKNVCFYFIIIFIKKRVRFFIYINKKNKK